MLPGGRAVIFTAHTATSGFDDANIDVITIADHRRRTLLRGGSFGRYLPSGHLTYVRRGVLYAMPFDISHLAPRGKAMPVIGDVNYSATFGSAQVDVSRTGTLVYRTGKSQIRSVTLQVLDQSGRQEALLAKPEGYLNPRISPEGKRVAISAGRGAARGLWVYNQPSNTTTSVHPQGRAGHAIWTPDGHFLVFHDEGGLFWMRAEDRDPVRLIASENFQVPTSFSPDGKTLVYQEASATGVGGWDIWVISVENDGTQLRARDARPFLQTAAHEYNAAFSPDGRWLAYNSDASGRSEVYVRAFPDDGRNWQISNSGGSCRRYSHAADSNCYS